jgi:hypothetical protein
MTEDKKGEETPSERPVCCQLVPERGMFRVLRAKGKTIISGGFGVAIPEENVKDNSKEESERPQNESASDCGDKTSKETDGTTTKSCDYLFIEEVVFLHERGLLDCLGNDTEPLDLSQLYQLLSQLGMSLPMYLVFAHLRSQDFRVLRHAPERLKLLRHQETAATLPRKEARALRRQVRETIQHAEVPVISNPGICICWDAYQPNSEFAKTHPGLPDFCVAVTYYGEAHVSFSEIQSLVVKNDGHDIPIKLATVSDSGTVVMFGLTNFGVPSIVKE